MTNRSRFLAAGFSLALLLAFIWNPPVQRTQEARVLQTAREMLGHDWLIPHLNGEIRLEKPPLAYWLAAMAFKIGGVSEGVGRVPFALAGWLTLMVIYFAGRWLASERVGMLAAAVLLGMWMFARHTRLAETDILATLFVTAAIACIWRGWHAASGAMIGIAAMAKGLPAAFPLIFLIALSIATRDRRLLWRWTKSGAPLIAAAIGSPWFIYAATTVGPDKFTLETKKGLFGLQHAASFLQYFPQLLIATLPWVVAVVIAIVYFAQRWRDDPKARGLLLWFGCIFIPLLLAGQRQFHYLMPTMPVLALMTAMMIESTRDTKLTRALLLGTCRPILAAFVVATATTLFAQIIAPSLKPESPRTIATKIRAIGEGPYCFYGENVSLPLLFYLGQTATRAATTDELETLISRSPETLVIAQTKSGVSPPPPPSQLSLVAALTSEDQRSEIYRVSQSH